MEKALLDVNKHGVAHAGNTQLAANGAQTQGIQGHLMLTRNHTFVNWSPDGRRGILLIKASLEQVRPYLVAAGWKSDAASAKYHYDFIMREVP